MAPAGFGFEVDLAISSAAFVFTATLWKVAHYVCETKLPKWNQFSKYLRDRMCVELAIIPTRVALAILTFPSTAGTFTSASKWGAKDTEMALIACSLMTGAYLFDLSIHRTDFLSTVHHCMGPALLLWIRCSFSSFTSADALVTRTLMMFVFYGASIGGSAATIGVFLLRVGKKYLSQKDLYKYFSMALSVLAVSTIMSCFMNTLYLLYRWDEMWGYFGLSFAMPIIWEGFECYLQWRWLLQFFKFENRFWSGRGKGTESPVEGLMTEVPVLELTGSAFPSSTVPAVKFMILIWSGFFTALVGKYGVATLGEIGHLAVN